MKTLSYKIVIAAVCVSVAAASLERPGEGAAAEKKSQDQSARYVIGISPFLEDAVKNEVYRHTLTFLLEDLPLNSSLWLYDAYHLRTIAQIEIPDVRAFRSGKTRANQFKTQIHKLKEFLAASHPKPESPKLKFNEAVRFPQLTDFIGENLSHGGKPVMAIVLGSPLYMDPKEPGFSMVDGYFPSDGHLLASRDETIFGIKNRPETLRGFVVHFAYFGAPWVSQIHQEKVTRFWSLYLAGQGGELARFCGDLPTVFNAAKPGSTLADLNRPKSEINRSHTKIEMLRVTRDIGVADWITRDVLPHEQHGPPSKTVGLMKIGIRWQGDIDLDLYSSPRPGAETLFFQHTRSPEGLYFKDHRSSPEREYEFIEFNSPVDLWQVEASINFYKGNASGGPSGEVRIEFDNKIYSGRFSISASRGNEGRSRKGQELHWTRIDVPAILKLTTRLSQPTPEDHALNR